MTHGQRLRAAFLAAGLTCLPGLPFAASADGPFASGATAAGAGTWGIVARRIAEPLGHAPSDFDLLTFYRTDAPSAPSAVATLLRRPASLDSLLPALRADVMDTSRSGFTRSEGMWGWLDAGLQRSAGKPGTGWGDRAAREGARLSALAARLDRDETAFLLRGLPSMFRPSVEDTVLDAVARDLARRSANAAIDSVVRLARRWPLDSLALAASGFDGLLDELLATLAESGTDSVIRMLREAGRRAGVPVAIGTDGDDVHHLRHGIVFDPGGNDRYVFPDTVRPGGWLMVVDVSGDDTYHATDSAGGAAAFLSVQLVADLGGNDRYTGADFAFASAIMGYARLLDVSGDDVYEAGSASLGFAFHGVAILQDRSGDDRYSSAYLSQAASSHFGFAALVDEAGNDRYVSNPVFVDDLRYEDHFLSLGQGFSTGFAPGHGGGIAVLHDRAGNDTYHADIFGQGAGYWFAWGVLLDDAGDDRHEAYQYAQGAGVHFAVGTLVDGAGNDVRRSKGVSQGCGHDGALGVLVDVSGNDSTYSVDMSTGAGSANGVGIFLDAAGDDAYVVGNPRMTLGHADMRRERPSYGFFLELAGKDAYTVSGEDRNPVPFRNGATWRTYDGIRRGMGVGVDGE